MNKLELLLECAGKALLEQSKVAKGVKVKGQKVTYVQALQDLNKLTTYFQYKGARTYGICGDCNQFTIRGHSSQYGEFGTCKKQSKAVHYFEGCQYSSNAI